MDVGLYITPTAAEYNRHFPVVTDAVMDDIYREILERRDVEEDVIWGRVLALIESLRMELWKHETSSGYRMDVVTGRMRKENAALWMILGGLADGINERSKVVDALPADVLQILTVMDKAIGFIIDNPQRSREAVVKIQKRLDDYLKETGDEADKA